MVAVAAIGALALVGAVIAGVTWRRGIDERQSVQQYRSALDTLRHVSDRIEDTRPRPVPRAGRTTKANEGSPSPVTAQSPVPTARVRQRSAGAAHSANGAAAADAAGAAHGATVRSAGVAPGGAADAVGARARPAEGSTRGAAAGNREPLVFDDAAPPMTGADGAAASDPAARRAIARMGDPGHDWLRHPVRIVLGAVATVAVVAGAVALGSGSSHPPPAIAPRTHTTPPSPTTLPSVVEATSSSASSATYAARSDTFTVVLAASGDCWVKAVDATGKLLWTGTMVRGETQTLDTASGTIEVNLGAASNVTMTLLGKPVVLPPQYQSPFIATFTSSGSTTPSA